MSNIPWDLIVAAAIEIIMKCIDNGADRDQIRAACRQPSPSLKAIVQFSVRQEILGSDDFRTRREARRYWRDNRMEIMDGTWERAAEMTDPEIDYLMSQAA